VLCAALPGAIIAVASSKTKLLKMLPQKTARICFQFMNSPLSPEALNLHRSF
jgi:hypothetical protein